MIVEAHQMIVITDTVVEAGARALRLWWLQNHGRIRDWEKIPEVVRQRYRDEFRAGLTAALEQGSIENAARRMGAPI